MNLLKTFEVTIDHTNKRLKAFDLEDSKSQITILENIAKEEGLEKIILFQKELEEINYLYDQGFINEGKIDGFFDGESAHLLSKYITEERQVSDNQQEEDEIITTILTQNKAILDNQLSDSYNIRNATDEDIPQIIEVFSKVFETYPTPMNDEEYIKKAINSNLDMAVVENSQNAIVGLSSAEIDFTNNNAEITDCATLPSERGKGLMNQLIQHLEDKMKQKDVVNLFSIARARSFGMNKVLYNLNYKYRGRLINNVHIAGSWENMNIWVKKID